MLVNRFFKVKYLLYMFLFRYNSSTAFASATFHQQMYTPTSFSGQILRPQEPWREWEQLPPPHARFELWRCFPKLSLKKLFFFHRVPAFIRM